MLNGNTITYNLQQNNCCSTPQFEQDYSIHLEGRLSREEFAIIMGDLNSHWIRLVPKKNFFLDLGLFGTYHSSSLCIVSHLFQK